jgi:hypothetical protein
MVQSGPFSVAKGTPQRKQSGGKRISKKALKNIFSEPQLVVDHQDVQFGEFRLAFQHADDPADPLR